MLDAKRAEIQDKAVEAWVEAGKKGTVNLSTGIGKTFCFLKACRLLPKGSRILFLAETTQREFDLMKDIQFFEKVYGWNLLQEHSLTFSCYQSACKWQNTEWDLVCADEIHSSLTPVYGMFYKQNQYGALLGLSATIDRGTTYVVDEQEVDKGMMVDSIAPVCFKYTLNEAVSDGTAKKLRMFIIYHQLDDVHKNVPAGTKANPFMTTEKASYDYWDSEFRRTLFLPEGQKKLFRIRMTSAGRAKVLYNLPSKITAVQELLKVLEGKTLVFGNSIDALTQVTPNVISNKKTDKQNQKIREDFDNGVINTVGSFKMLKQGANLKDLDNTILMSYYSKELDMIQAIGRQRVSDQTGNVFIYMTLGTQEAKWYKKAMENITNYEEIYCNGTEDCIKKYQKLMQSEQEACQTAQQDAEKEQVE
jgi:superfamily II DNA or RNA helicase